MSLPAPIVPIPDAVNAILEPFMVKVEGRFPKPYRDQGGVWTDGIGNTHGVVPGRVKTALQIDADFKANATAAYNQLLTHLAPAVRPKLTNHNLVALISFVFNEGIGNLTQSSLLREINQGKFVNVAVNFKKYCEVRIDGDLVFDQGVYNRRLKEIAMWNTPDTPPAAAAA